MISRVQNNQVQSEWFVALITQVGTTDTTDSKGIKGTPHAWTRLAPGELYQNNVDSDFPKVKGTLTDSPAYALDGSKAAVNDKVLMRFYGTPKGMPVYQFAKAGATSGGGTITSIGTILEVEKAIDGAQIYSGWLVSRNDSSPSTLPGDYTFRTRGDAIYICNLDYSLSLTNSFLPGQLVTGQSYGRYLGRALYASHSGLVRGIFVVSDVQCDFGTITVNKRTIVVRG